MAGQTNEREVILDILLDIDKDGTYSHIAISETLKNYQFLDKKVRAFITRVVEGTIEYQLRIDYILNQFSKTKMKKCKPVIRTLLRMAAYQICFLDQVPDSAACNEAVKLAKKRGFSSLSGFVNGVLRNLARKREEIVYPSEEKEPIEYLSIFYSMPKWIVEDWLSHYDYQTVKAMLQAFLAENKTTIRCHTSKISPEELKMQLQEEGINVTSCPYVKEAFFIDGYNYMQRIKAFREGLFQVQDQSSMLVVQVANPKEGDTVLDVCAAPGGKSLHCAEELKGTGLVIARDLTDYKVGLMQENLERIGYKNMKIQRQDAKVLVEADREKADLVIADLPCSGLGILGKKNDIKYKMSKEQQKQLVELQREILSVVWQYVKPGGTLLYSTCTIHYEENEGNRKWLLENFPLEEVSLDDRLPKELWSDTTKEGYLQLLPGIHSCDGFFLAKFKRK